MNPETPENDRRFRLLFERSLDAIVVFDDDGRYLDANDAACTLFGYSRAQLLTMRLIELSTVGRPTTAQLFASYLVSNRDSGHVHLRRPDGAECIVEYAAIKIAPNEHICIARDATERDRSLLALRRLAAIVASSDESIAGVSCDGTITDWNQGAERLYGYTSAEVVGKPITILAAPNHMEEEREVLRRVLRGESIRNMETVRVRKDGRQVDVSLTTSTTLDVTGHIVGHSTISHDISERKLLERELLELSDRERRRIGQDLHDVIGQELVGLALRAGGLSESLAKADYSYAQVAREIQNGLKESIDHVREISAGMIPISIDAGGLTAALRDLANRVDMKTGIKCDFVCVEPVALDDSVKANEIFRIAQEAVTNAVNHARARDITITLNGEPDRVVLRINDDGIGMPMPPPTTLGMGLRIMRYRADLIGATLTLDAKAGQGSIVCCVLPYPTAN